MRLFKHALESRLSVNSLLAPRLWLISYNCRHQRRHIIEAFAKWNDTRVAREMERIADAMREEAEAA